MTQKPAGDSWLCPGCSDNGENGNLKQEEEELEEEPMETQKEVEALVQAVQAEKEKAVDAVKKAESVETEVVEPEPPKKKLGKMQLTFYFCYSALSLRVICFMIAFKVNPMRVMIKLFAL